MRDLIVTLIVFGSLPVILARPYVGVLVWSWLGYMNPHRLTWGFAFSFPFSQFVAIVTLVGLLFSKEKKQFPWTAITVVWILWVVWMNVTTVFALVPEFAIPEWERAMKIQLMVLVTILLMTSRERIDWLVWTIVVSLGFFGVKGGLFSLLTGGQYLVMGPMYSFIGENNSLALALIMTLPLMRYLQLQANRKLVKWGLMLAMGLTGLSILTSHSRGAFLAGAAMILFLIWKSRNRLRIGIGVLIFLPIMLAFMPEAWFDRMATIQTYQQDASAMGRINAWWFAYHVALDRPLVGGGFTVFTPELFHIYAPDPDDFHDSHSIYFEVLGEHGFVGLILFLALGGMALATAGAAARQARRLPELSWAADLAAMLQVSLIGYAVGGSFLGLAYYDLYYHLVSIIVVVSAFAKAALRAQETEKLEESSASLAPSARALQPDEHPTGASRAR